MKAQGFWYLCTASDVPLNSQKKSKYMYSPLLYNERHKSPIQYTKNKNGMASLVGAIRKKN